MQTLPQACGRQPRRPPVPHRNFAAFSHPSRPLWWMATRCPCIGSARAWRSRRATPRTGRPGALRRPSPSLPAPGRLGAAV